MLPDTSRTRAARPGDSGVALIVVVLMLAALAAVAAPFMLSAALGRRESRTFAARSRARHVADGALARALWSLTRTAEVAEREGRYPAPFDTPDWDTLSELEVSFVFPRPPVPKGKARPPAWPEESLDSDTFHDPRGEIWTATVEDEQGKINVNSATPALLGNLLGSAVLDGPLGRNDGGTLQLSGTWTFASDGDDRTIDGFVRIGREILAYTGKTGTTLEGVTRGEFGTEPDDHPDGALVYDARGWAISALRMTGARSAGPSAFPVVSGIRGIAKFGVNRGGRDYRLALSPAEFEAAEAYLTVGSYRPKADGWVRREEVLTGAWEADQTGFLLKDNSNYGSGTVVRFLDESERVRGYGRVLGAQARVRPGAAGGGIALEYGVGFAHGGGSRVFIEAELPHAVNVNTARIPVLAACMTGLALQGAPAVTPQEAWLVANRLVGYTVRGREDLNAVLLEAVREGDLENDLKRQAILENATVSGSTRLRVCTAPFCYRAYGQFTVEASGVVNSPTSGRPLAVHTIRQAVQMPSDPNSMFLVRSQKDFEEQLRSGFGRRVVTWPVAMIDRDSAPDESVEDYVGDVRLGTGRVGRALPGTVLVDNCERPVAGAALTPDGRVLAGGAGLSYASARCFARAAGSVRPGSLEAWIKAGESWGGSIFRAAQSDDRNMIDVRYDDRNGELVMELADGTREGRKVTYRQPYDLDRGVWYHVKAIYKSTRLGGQMLVVDGGQTLPRGPGRYEPSTRLTENLDDWSSLPPGTLGSVSVDSTGGFPSRGALVIDGEIMEYTSRKPGSFEGVRRARRYTQAAAHSSGAAVQIWGYAVRLGSAIPQVSGRVADDIGGSFNCRIDAPPDPGPPPTTGGLDDSETEIKVNSTAGFQRCGYLWVDRECIYYGRRTATQFLDCRRAQRGTVAARHAHNRAIVPASLLVTDLSGYPSSGHVQIDDAADSNRVEWIGYEATGTVDGNRFLLPGVHTDSGGNRYMSSWRGNYGTGSRAHARNAMVIPVFALSGPECGDQNSPQYEPVTVTDGLGQSEAALLKRVYEGTNFWVNLNTGQQGWTHTWLAALDRFTGRTYSGADARLLKYPSGELAIDLPDLRVGRGFEGEIDEVRAAAGHGLAGKLPADLTLASGSDAVVVQMPSSAEAQRVPPAGVLRVNDEVIYYTGRSVGTRTLPWTPRLPFRTPQPQYDTRDFPVVTLSGVRRAVLGTGSASHGSWSPAAFLEACPVTELSASTDRDVTLVRLRSGAGFEAEGCALVGSEIVGYSRLAGSTLEGTHFRGSYGTVAQPHGAGTLAMPLPFRYWDRYLAESDLSEMAYFQGSYSAAGTNWNRIGLVMTPAQSVKVHVLVRFDGAPGWETPPTNRDGGIYAFDGPGPHELRSVGGRRVRADQIEYRLLFEYLPGAHRGAGWKQTPQIDTVYIEYGNPLVVLHREVLKK